MTSQQQPRHLHIVKDRPGCTHTVDNGKGIVFACTKPEHPKAPDQHYMKPVKP